MQVQPHMQPIETNNETLMNNIFDTEWLKFMLNLIKKRESQFDLKQFYQFKNV